MNEIDYFEQGKLYLLEFDGISEEMIDAQLNAWKDQKVSSLPEVYKALLNHAKNRRGMPNSIGKIENIEHLLFSFDHKKVLEAYPAWDALFDSINEDPYTPPGRMEKSNNKNLWVVYCKAIISAAEFLIQFETYKDFESFTKPFWASEYTKLSLPLLLSTKIFGLGFALACDFIKENISPEFLKPDTHIRDIAQGLGITKSSNDFIVYRDVEGYCRRVGKIPYEVDKLFWLIGSGKFYIFGVEVKTNKKKFIAKMKELTNKASGTSANAAASA